MENHEKIIELMKIADQLRAEVIGASGQAQAMAMDLNISACLLYTSPSPRD